MGIRISEKYRIHTDVANKSETRVGKLVAGWREALRNRLFTCGDTVVEKRIKKR